jgi:hypothetical protein
VVNFLRSLEPMAFHFIEHLPNQSKAATVAFASAEIYTPVISRR